MQLHPNYWFRWISSRLLATLMIMESCLWDVIASPREEHLGGLTHFLCRDPSDDFLTVHVADVSLKSAFTNPNNRVP